MGAAGHRVPCLRVRRQIRYTLSMADEDRATPKWLDLLGLLFLLGLAVLPPIGELHKQIILLIIGAFQLVENRFVLAVPKGGRALSVIIKIVLASVLINHTGDVGINSAYYPIFYLPIMTAAMYYGPVATLLWTLLASSAYCSYLYVALEQYDLTADGITQLSIRILFFFLVAMVINRFVVEYRAQSRRYQLLAETLSEANRDLKQARDEAQRAERLAALGQLSAGLAHEIRNPLGVIKGSAEILTQKLANSEPLAQELSGYIYTEVNRLSALVSRFLDFARPSRLELRPEQVGVLLERSWKSVVDLVKAAKVEVHRDFGDDLPSVMLDEGLCDQAFTNLLLNGCEAMGDQGGELTIRTRSEESDGRHEIVIEIEDTGPGVPPNLREQIFNPFVTTKETGVGLGLAIVSKIIDAHGGTIRVVDGKGRGACFQIRFPTAEEYKYPEQVEQQFS